MLSGATASGDGTTGRLLLSGARLIDGTGAAPVERSWLRIEDGRITGVGQGQPPDSPEFPHLELRDHTIFPGLTDMHVHLGPLVEAKWTLKLTLAHGVTTVKEAGNQHGNIAAIRRWQKVDPVLPRVFSSGKTINGSEIELRFLPAGHQTQRLLENNLALGVDFLKIHNWISSGAFRQIVDFSRRHDVPLTGHVPLSMTSAAAIAGGMSILEHVRLQPAEIHDDPARVGRFPLDLVVMRRTGHWADFDERSAAVQRTLETWQAHRDAFFLDPTLVVQEAVAYADGPDRPVDIPISLTSPATRARLGPAADRYGELSPDERVRARGSVAGMTAFVRLARERGIRILTGTDVSVPWIVPGASLLRELELLVDAGMTPVEAIHASTGQAAAALRATERGVLRAGAIADLVVVRGDVSREIRRARDIEHVVLGGAVHQPSALLASAAALAALDTALPA